MLTQQDYLYTKPDEYVGHDSLTKHLQPKFDTDDTLSEHNGAEVEEKNVAININNLYIVFSLF